MKKFSLRPKKIPTLLGVFIVFVSVLTGLFFINKARKLNSLASSETSPRLVKITNIDSASFVISWITDTQTTGSISYGESQSLGMTKNDIRNEGKAVSLNYKTHFVSVDDLKPSTRYLFKIISSGKAYGSAGNLFEVTTGPQKLTTDNDIAQGTIYKGNGGPAAGAIVYLSLANTLTQAAITDSSGRWVIPLSTARTLDRQNYANYDREAQIEEIFVQGENQTASATLSTGNDNPVPDIILGQNYDFLAQLPERPTATPTQTRVNDNFNLSTGFSDINEGAELTILFPTENENIHSQIPEFLGTGPKNKKIEILVESNEEMTGKAVIGTDGKWNWATITPLSPGEHQITVSYTDEKGFINKVVRKFTVLAADQSGLPSFTATGSGQTATATPKPSPTPTVKAVSPTMTPTPAPLSPTPTGVNLLPEPTTSPPASGTTLPTKIFIGVGGAAIIIGIILTLL